MAENGVVWEWRWGLQAATEIGEAAIARFIAGFMAERVSEGAAGGKNAGAGGEDRSDEEVGGRGAISLREDAQKRLTALLKGVELAAGRALAGPTVLRHASQAFPEIRTRYLPVSVHKLYRLYTTFSRCWFYATRFSCISCHLA